MATTNRDQVGFSDQYLAHRSPKTTPAPLNKRRTGMGIFWENWMKVCMDFCLLVCLKFRENRETGQWIKKANKRPKLRILGLGFHFVLVCPAGFEPAAFGSANQRSIQAELWAHSGEKPRHFNIQKANHARLYYFCK